MMNIRGGAGIMLICVAAGLLWQAAPALGNGAVSSDVTAKEADAAREAEARRKELEAKRIAAKRAEEARRAAEKKAAARAAAEKAAAEAARREAEAAAERHARALREGRRLVEEGQFLTAARYLSRILSGEYANSAEGWYWLSRAHHALGDYDRAQWAANVALELDPYYPALTKTPSGLQPLPKPQKDDKGPKPSMSVLPVVQPIPIGRGLEPTVISLPILELRSGDVAVSDDASEAALALGLDDEREPGSDFTPARLRYEPYPPLPAGRTISWMQGERFGEISRWRFRVDSMAILEDLGVPVAWKGVRPYEIYFWTGSEWARFRNTGKQRVDDALLRVLDSLRDVLEENGFAWDEADTPALASAAMGMRYWWTGGIDLSEARRRAEEKVQKAEPGDNEAASANIRID